MSLPSNGEEEEKKIYYVGNNQIAEASKENTSNRVSIKVETPAFGKKKSFAIFKNTNKKGLNTSKSTTNLSAKKSPTSNNAKSAQKKPLLFAYDVSPTKIS